MLVILKVPYRVGHKIQRQRPYPPSVIVIHLLSSLLHRGLSFIHQFHTLSVQALLAQHRLASGSVVARVLRCDPESAWLGAEAIKSRTSKLARRIWIHVYFKKRI